MENTTDSQPLPLFYHTILEQLELDISYPERIHKANCALEQAKEEIATYEILKNRNLERIASLEKTITQEESALHYLQEEISKHEQLYAVDQRRDFKDQIQFLTQQKEAQQKRMDSFCSQLAEEKSKIIEQPNSEIYTSAQKLTKFIHIFENKTKGEPAPEPFQETPLELDSYSRLLSQLDKTLLTKDYYYFMDSLFIHPRYFPSAQTPYKEYLGFEGEKAYALELWLLLTNPETKPYLAWDETYLDLHRDYFCLVKAKTLPQPQAPGIFFAFPLSPPLGGPSELRRHVTKQAFDPPMGFALFDGKTLYTHRFVLKQFGKIR